MEHSILTQLTSSERERLLEAAEAHLISKTIKSAPIGRHKEVEKIYRVVAQQRLWFWRR